MIGAIADLGKYEKNQNPELSSFDIWLEDSFDGGKYGHLLLITFEKNGENWIYKGIDYLENSAAYKAGLLYKRGSSRGSDKTPTAKVAKSIAGTFTQKIKGWFEKFNDSGHLSYQEKTFLINIRDEMNQKAELILSDLEEKAAVVENSGIVLSVQFVENGDLKKIGEYPFFSKFITEESKAAYKHSPTFKKDSFSEHALCSVCNCIKEEVFGFFTALGFYTVDKPGMVTGGFSQDQSWKNYPVCLGCALDIEMGIKIKEQYLDFSLYGLRYYVIPKILKELSKFEIIDEILSLKTNPKINDKDRVTITGAEEDIFDLVKDVRNYVHFNLVFYDKPQKGVFRILTNIEEVLPSRIRRLFDVKADVDDMVFFKIKGKDGKQIFRFHFGIVRSFFPNDKIHGNYNKAFLQIVSHIFTGIRVDYRYVLLHIMRRVRESFVNGENEWLAVVQGFMLLVYLSKLGVLNANQGDVNSMDRAFYQSFEIRKTEEFEDKVFLFFNNFNTFFQTDIHKSIFLLGVLTKFLLNIQSRERNATPFRSKLKGLKMDSRDLVTLFPSINEKLAQYQANYYKPLENLIAKLLINAGDHTKWNIPVDELNYIFSLGMNLSDNFKIKGSDKKQTNKGVV